MHTYIAHIREYLSGAIFLPRRIPVRLTSLYPFPSESRCTTCIITLRQPLVIGSKQNNRSGPLNGESNRLLNCALLKREDTKAKDQLHQRHYSIKRYHCRGGLVK